MVGVRHCVTRVCHWQRRLVIKLTTLFTVYNHYGCDEYSDLKIPRVFFITPVLANLYFGSSLVMLFRLPDYTNCFCCIYVLAFSPDLCSYSNKVLNNFL